MELALSGVEGVGAGQAGLGFTGEWSDSNVGLLYLRARWYKPRVGRFTRVDPWEGTVIDPLTLNPYVYALANPVNFNDPSGFQSESEKFYIRLLYKLYLKDAAARLNVRSLTNLSDNAFVAMIAARILVEDATVFADRRRKGIERTYSDFITSYLPQPLRDKIEQQLYGGEISWGPANMRLDFVIGNLEWWEQNHSELGSSELGHGSSRNDVRTWYYSWRDSFLPDWLIGSERTLMARELLTGEGTVNQMALAILRSSWQIKQYRERKYLESGGCVQTPELSAYMIAMGIRNFQYFHHFSQDYKTEDIIFDPDNWTSRGMPWDWIEAMDDTAIALGFHLKRADPRPSGPFEGWHRVQSYDYLPYTKEEKDKLDSIPH
ncbi:MAG: hypothetical protein DRJ03_31960 [Chloroflexi bacterium]|nr:MAG: hypothetical protein DRJ03_31960 [Chloroflexota bacterium]